MERNPEDSKLFSHWDYTGNRAQKALKIGPKKAFYHNYEASELRAAFDAGESVELDMSRLVKVTDRKAIPVHQWMLNYAEESLSSPAGLVAQSPWAFRCIDIKSKTMAAIPWGIFKDGEEVEGPNDYKDRLEKVNPEMNWPDLAMATAADLDVYGKAFWLKVRNDSQVIGLRRLNPSTIKIDADERGIKQFNQVLPKGGTNEFTRQDVVFFHLYDAENDFGGVAPLQVAKRAIKIDLAADSHLEEFFLNKAMPDYIMSLETTNVEEIKRVAEAWKREFAGKGSQHKTGWVGGGATPHQVGYAPDELALKEVRDETRKQICSSFGVPPALVGATEAANYATIREQRQSLYTEIQIPTAKYIEGVINAELSPEFEGGYEFQWKMDEIPVMQEEVNSRAKRLTWLKEAGIIKPEVAALEMGYIEADVPEPAAIPTARNNNFAKETVDVRDSLREEKKGLMNKTEKALRKWRQKCKNNLQKGKKALCTFTSVYVDDTLTEAIKAQLEDAEDLDAVYDVFEQAILWRNYP